ncbi:MAG: metallophosphoesterase [Clostridia bacterium]|nr:metallophosphoesterase [Clostridia bacterium]MBR3681768.1 metallophosphoesterase [Clostridia bacterium]
MSETVQGKRLKFLHCGDIHLDNPFAGLPADKSEERRRELRASFAKMMEYVRERQIDYVLICGDLFESEFATGTTADIIIRELKNTPSAKFIIAPGRADSYSDNPLYLSGRLPSNCFVFSSDTLSRFDFEEDRVTVYGWAFVGKEITQNPLLDKRVDDTSKINIVCGACDLDGELDSTLCPIASADLKKFGADYYAFGSRHGSSDFVKRTGLMYSYSGALASVGFDEPGLGGVKLLNIDYNEGELSIDGKQIPFGHLQFVTEQIDITGVNANNEITNRISKLISQKKYGIDTALRIELVGDIDPRFILPRALECDAFGLYYFEMIDKTMPLYNTKHFERDMSVAGELYRKLYPKMTGDNEEDRLVAARAFRVGLAALENRDIDG